MSSTLYEEVFLRSDDSLLRQASNVSGVWLFSAVSLSTIAYYIGLVVMLYLLYAFTLSFLGRGIRIIHYNDDPFWMKLCEEMKFSRWQYIPFIFAPGRWVQTGLILLYQALQFSKMNKKFSTQVVHTEKGDAYLHWFEGTPGCEKKPVVVIFPVFAGRVADWFCYATAKHFESGGYQCVVYNRRGHWKPSLYFSVTGDPFMTMRVLDAVKKAIAPGRGMHLIGFSAGTGPIIRYHQEIMMGPEENPHDVRIGIAISPGFTSNFGPDTITWVLDTLVSCANVFWITDLHVKEKPEVVEKLKKAKTLLEWEKHATAFAGPNNPTVQDFWDNNDPSGGWKRLDKLTDQEAVNLSGPPCIMFCARDDIMFPWAVVEKYLHHFQRTRSFAMIDTDLGGHCTFWEGLTGGNWSFRKSVEICQAVDRMSERK